MASSEVREAGAPPAFHLLAKPSGSTCYIDCTYCFFLSKEALYPNDSHRMSEATLETYIRQLLESHRNPQVTVAWQGGEPTQMKLDFFRRSVEMVEQYRRPGQTVHHTFQTNGILLDADWCAFFKEHNFLVGLSVDGPRDLHDMYRRDRGGRGTFDRVMRGWWHLRECGVDFNILCTVNAANENHGREVYRFLRDELEASWIQFVPIVERATAETLQIANRSWNEQYRCFLVDVFEEWVRHDVGKVYVQLFDVTLEAYFGRHLLADDARSGPYRPCPCGSGQKFRFCHGHHVPRARASGHAGGDTA